MDILKDKRFWIGAAVGLWVLPRVVTWGRSALDRARSQVAS